MVPFKLSSNTGRQVNLDSFQRQAKEQLWGWGTRDKGTEKKEKEKQHNEYATLLRGKKGQHVREIKTKKQNKTKQKRDKVSILEGSAATLLVTFPP